MKRTRYVCTRCGGDRTSVSDAHPSLDERYAIGHCDRCTPVPVPPAQRATVPLVRADLWTPETLRDRKEARRRERVVRKAIEPDSKRPPSDDEVDEGLRLIGDVFARAEGRHP